MRLLRKLVMKLVMMVVMVAVLGAAIRYARPYLMKSAGLPTGTGTGDVHFSSGESDLMATVFKSAMRLLTGQASRKELAGELSGKLYAGRADEKTMSELGIELVQPGGAGPSAPGAAPRLASAPPRANPPTSPGTPPAPAGPAANDPRRVFLTRLQNEAVANPELALVPVVLTGMLVAHGVRRRRRSPLDDLVLPDMTALMPSDSAPYEMTHAVHALKAEDFELLVALVYQRQGYRVSMPAGLSGGRGGDFLLLRRSERLLVQCKNQRQDFRLPVERVRELQEAVETAGATRGLFVTSCGFTWDARNYAKTKGMTVINARTLDALLTEAREDENEDLLAVAQWAPKFMAKVKLTPPVCPACEAEMEQIGASGGTVWVCSQRPDCRGRRNARGYQNAVPTKPAKPAKALDFAKLTKSIRVTKLTKLAPPAKAAVAPPDPGTPAKCEVPASPPAVSKPADALSPPARLLAAFPSPQRLALVTRRIFSSYSAPDKNKDVRDDPAAATMGKPAKI